MLLRTLSNIFIANASKNFLSFTPYAVITLFAAGIVSLLFEKITLLQLQLDASVSFNLALAADLLSISTKLSALTDLVSAGAKIEVALNSGSIINPVAANGQTGVYFYLFCASAVTAAAAIIYYVYFGGCDVPPAGGGDELLSKVISAAGDDFVAKIVPFLLTKTDVESVLESNSILEAGEELLARVVPLLLTKNNIESILDSTEAQRVVSLLSDLSTDSAVAIIDSNRSDSHDIVLVLEKVMGMQFSILSRLNKMILDVLPMASLTVNEPVQQAISSSAELLGSVS